MTTYTLASGVMIPVTAFLVGRFQTRAMYFCAMGLFASGTVIGVFSPSFELLIVSCLLQAVGAGMNMTLMQMVLFLVFPVDKRGTAMGFFGLVIAFAPAFGPFAWRQGGDGPSGSFERLPLWRLVSERGRRIGEDRCRNPKTRWISWE